MFVPVQILAHPKSLMRSPRTWWSLKGMLLGTEPHWTSPVWPQGSLPHLYGLRGPYHQLVLQWSTAQSKPTNNNETPHIANITESTDATRAGTSYHCTASNKFGTTHSKTATLFYAWVKGGERYVFDEVMTRVTCVVLSVSDFNVLMARVGQ